MVTIETVISCDTVNPDGCRGVWTPANMKHLSAMEQRRIAGGAPHHWKYSAGVDYCPHCWDWRQNHKGRPGRKPATPKPPPPTPLSLLTVTTPGVVVVPPKKPGGRKITLKIDKSMPCHDVLS